MGMLFELSLLGLVIFVGLYFFYLELIFLFFCETGSYIEAANALEQETKLGLWRFEVCDNIDLETILMEYESY